MNFPREFERNASQSRCATQPGLSATSLPRSRPAKLLDVRLATIPTATDMALRTFPFMAEKCGVLHKNARTIEFRIYATRASPFPRTTPPITHALRLRCLANARTALAL